MSTPQNRKLPPNDFRVKIPSLLIATDAWIGHRAKKPLMLPAGHRAAKTNVAKTWRPFDEALSFYERTIKDPNAGVGFVLQQDLGVVFLDFDHCLDEGSKLKSWAEPFLAPFRGKTFIERSVSGTGLHVLALGSIPRAFPDLTPPAADPAQKEHIDVYNNLRFIAITGDTWDGAPSSLTPLQPEIDALLVSLGAGGKDRESTPAPPPEDLSPQQLAERATECKSALEILDPDMAYEDWLRIGMALHAGLGQAGLALWDSWSARGSKYKRGETAERWQSFHRSGVTLGTLFFKAQEAGWRSPLDDPRNQFTPIDEPAEERRPEDLPFESGSFQEWVDGGYQLWKPNPKQEILIPCFNEANLHRFFTHHPDWKGRLRFNIRSQYPEVDSDEVDLHRSYRALAQSHAFLGWDKRAYSVKTVQATIQAVAEARPFDPIAEWLQTLEWDGTPRVDSLCATLGIEDTPVTRRCLTRWLIGAVARAFRPGCKMQNMLLLLGPQGRQKSGLLERLATRAAWFHESHIEIKGKEGYITLDRKWIVEFAELDALRKVDIEKVKAFISESTSNYRSPYARTAEDHARHFVLAGTANEDKVLRDPTGARRFWPIRCPGLLNLASLTPPVVAQVWAEARTMYTNGVRWWDETEEVDEINARNAEFFSESAADVMIAKVLEEEFAPHGALHMKVLVSRLHELHIIQPSTPANVVGSVLRHNHWTDQTFRIDGKTVRFWVPQSSTQDERKQAAVICLTNWRKAAGVFDPISETAK